MAKVIKYKGYRIGQTGNNHIWATKDGRMALHAQCDKQLSEDELKATFDNLLRVAKSNYRQQS